MMGLGILAHIQVTDDGLDLQKLENASMTQES
jgi:hypothetical protein